MVDRAAWHVATVASVRPETATARRIELDVPTWPGNDAGAHLDVRLSAPDGYQATRSYSIASSGSGTRVILAVDELPDGEVSPFLVHDLRVGDQVELHGPLGAFFIWTPPVDSTPPRPVQLIAVGPGWCRSTRWPPRTEVRAMTPRFDCCTRCGRPMTSSSAAN